MMSPETLKESVHVSPSTLRTVFKVGNIYTTIVILLSLVPVKLITYPGPGPLADDISNLDIGNIANETERAKTIEFSSAYCNIQATYLVPAGSRIQTISDVDKPGVRIVAKAS